MAPTGPGYATPLDAMKHGPKEEILYVVAIQPNANNDCKSDLLATVDVNPESPTYCEIIHRLHTGKLHDEIHHTGWNVCSSCHNVKKGCTIPVRDKLVMPALGSDRVYIVDTGKNPRAPVMHKVIENSELHAFNCATPHTSHCLPSGEIMISILGNVEGSGRGNFILIDGKTYKVKGTWVNGKEGRFNYDYWYQPYFDVMVATEWAHPKLFKRGFSVSDLNPTLYGQSLNVYSWKNRDLLQTIDLGKEGVAPLEVRFLHDPKKPFAYVGCAVGSNVFKITQKDCKWDAEICITTNPKKVSGWIMDFMPGLITDILISLDDKYLYLCNWFHGDVRQYDITNPHNPKLTGQVFLGGLILSDSKITVLEDPDLKKQPDPVYIKGRRLYGSPQMLQLSLDGKRLYVSTSLLSPWDEQFYKDVCKYGGHIVKLDINCVNGGMTLDEKFLVDFGIGPDGPLLPHEMRYPGGDCTSDIWLADD